MEASVRPGVRDDSWALRVGAPALDALNRLSHLVGRQDAFLQQHADQRGHVRRHALRALLVHRRLLQRGAHGI